jgi:hypothetical protein
VVVVVQTVGAAMSVLTSKTMKKMDWAPMEWEPTDHIQTTVMAEAPTLRSALTA